MKKELEKYITETTNEHGEKYGWDIWANSYEEAEKIAERRGIGEKILGHIPNDCEDCEWQGELTEELISKFNINLQSH